MREEIIGSARLLLADCRDVLPGLSGVDAIVTDPPYGISDAAFTGKDRVGKRKGGSNDWHAPSDWDHFIDPIWAQLCCNTAPIVAWFGHWRKREEVSGFMPHPLRAEIVWAKDCHVGPPCPVAMRDERIWLFSVGGIKPARFDTSIWEVPIIPTWKRKDHKNEKPVALMSRLVTFFDAPVICDPFMGSGTTGVACMMAGRSFVGCEVSPEHFDVACRRIEAAHRQADLFAPQPAPKPAVTAELF